MYVLCLKILSLKGHVEKIKCTQTNNYIHLQMTEKKKKQTHKLNK
jgi:hypothetical protein